MEKQNIVLGTWAWGDNNSYFGNQYNEEHFKPVFDQALKRWFEHLGHCLCLWYGEFRENSW